MRVSNNLASELKFSAWEILQMFMWGEQYRKFTFKWLIGRHGRTHALFHAVRMGAPFINIDVIECLFVQKAHISRYFIQRLVLGFGLPLMFIFEFSKRSWPVWWKQYLCAWKWHESILLSLRWTTSNQTIDIRITKKYRRYQNVNRLKY